MSSARWTGKSLTAGPRRASRCLALPGFLLLSLLIASAHAAQITILETSDVHGHLAPWDYFEATPADLGLGAAAAIVEREREADPDLLLLDGGDTIQGTPLVDFYNLKRPEAPNPMAVVMNAMGYDAMAVGNHEYNFGQTVLDSFIRHADFPVLSANITDEGGEPRYTPYLVKTVKGVRIGIVGLTTPGILVWEKPRHIEGLRFDPVLEIAEHAVSRLREQGATVIIGLCHSGLGPGPEDAEYHASPEPSGPRNFVRMLAEQVEGFDVILAGHTHRKVEQQLISGVLIVQPDHWGRGVSKVVLRTGEQGRVETKTGSFLPVSRSELGAGVQALCRAFHLEALNYVNTAIGVAAGDFPGGMDARTRDGPLADFLCAIQMEMARAAGYDADVVISTVFQDAGHFAAGPITVSDVYAVYPYPNTLTVLELPADALRRALEHNTGYWKQPDPSSHPPSAARELVAAGQRDYNWDMYCGIEYAVDITRPAGGRIVELLYRGAPLNTNRTLVVAVNNYRAGGSGGFTMFKEGKVLWESAQLIREHIIEHVRTNAVIRPDAYHHPNWRMLPERLFP